MKHILKCHEIVKTDFVHGENCYLFDGQGNRFIDFESGIWCTALGYSHPRINQIIHAQIDKVIHLGTRYPNILAEEAAIEILDIAGFDNGKCVFLSSGSEAVELGVQIARRCSERSSLLAFSNSYLAAFGSAGRKSSHEWFLFDWSACASENLSECSKEIPFESIGAFVFEPGGSGLGFVKFPPEQLVQDISQRVKQEGGLLVANEVTTGMGRTGKWFGFQHYDIEPDIIALGKGLGNGYPVSAVVMRTDTAEKLEKSGFHYVQSHQNDPLGCAVAREVIAVLREENLIERGNAIGIFFLEGLNRLVEKYAVLREARGRGLLLGLEFFPHERITVEWVYHALLKRGFLAGYYPAGNVLRFDPALTVEKKDVSHLLACLDEILENTV
ncbi:MAG: aspartate aminotransferase family protein [Candidatus Aminicenantes bacterium]|nr:aspartate aminotransferase family protein [Candidatus Aminicenantes bacterium]